MVDGGANVHILVEEGAARLLALTPVAGSIAGISNGLGYSHRGTDECELGPHGAHDVTLNFLYAPDGKRTILSESKLLDNHGIQAIKTPGPGHLLFRDGSKVPLVRSNGLSTATSCFDEVRRLRRRRGYEPTTSRSSGRPGSTSPRTTSCSPPRRCWASTSTRSPRRSIRCSRGAAGRVPD